MPEKKKAKKSSPKPSTQPVVGGLIQLATRIPQALHREIKLLVIREDTSIMAFIQGALEREMARVKGK